jgi:hypothetical protein
MPHVNLAESGTICAIYDCSFRCLPHLIVPECRLMPQLWPYLLILTMTLSASSLTLTNLSIDKPYKVFNNETVDEAFAAASDNAVIIERNSRDVPSVSSRNWS